MGKITNLIYKYNNHRNNLNGCYNIICYKQVFNSLTIPSNPVPNVNDPDFVL
jgi:hypothetical protein